MLYHSITFIVLETEENLTYVQKEVPYLNRDVDHVIFLTCERYRGKPIFETGVPVADNAAPLPQATDSL